MQTIYCSMPLYVELGKIKKKKHYINLNNARNWHYQVSNNIKKAYQEIATKQLKDFRFSKFEKVEIDFVLYKGSKRKIDRSNVLSMVEKFFCDAMVGMQVIEDDNDNYIESTRYFSGYDKNDPRVEIFIKVVK